MQDVPKPIDKRKEACFNADKGFREPMYAWRGFQIHFKKVEETKHEKDS